MAESSNTYSLFVLFTVTKDHKTSKCHLKCKDKASNNAVYYIMSIHVTLD